MNIIKGQKNQEILLKMEKNFFRVEIVEAVHFGGLILLISQEGKDSQSGISMEITMLIS